MSMLLPPQMLNTMVPAARRTSRGSPRRSTPTRCAATWSRPSATGGPTGPPTRTRSATRCTRPRCGRSRASPTATPPRCSPNCCPPARSTAATAPGWTWSATRPRSTDKHKFALAREDRLAAMLSYLRRTPGVRDVVVSGGDVANLPWPRLESFVAALLEIDSIRDIRLASKALMGLPQHWLSGRGPGGHDPARRHGPRARGEHRHPHPRERRPVGDPAGRPGRPGHDGGRRPRRAEPGRAAARHQRQRRCPARPVLRAARRGQASCPTTSTCAT